MPLTMNLPPSSCASTACSRKLLVVDDSPQITDALVRLLEMDGFEVAAFNAALPALDYARRHPVDGAILDIHMPDLSGLIVSQQLRSLIGDTAPIIILSGDVSMEVLNALSHVGATHFFSKPLQPDTLIARLNELLSPSETP